MSVDVDLLPGLQAIVELYIGQFFCNRGFLCFGRYTNMCCELVERLKLLQTGLRQFDFRHVQRH